MKAFFLLCTLALSVGIASMPESFACTCEPATLEQHIERADAVFIGTAAYADKSDETHYWNFTDMVSFKGAGQNEIHSVANTPNNGAGCGHVFAVGSEYLVFAKERMGIMETSMCDGSMPVWELTESDIQTLSDLQVPSIGFEVKTIAENLRVPWAIDFAPDGRIFFTERGGEIRVIEDGVLLSEPLKKLDVGSVEGGMLGIALDPNFEENHYVYVYYTYTDFVFTYNKVVRFTEADNRLADEFTLIEKIPGGPIHDGGRIKFADDGTLYITTGDAGNPGLAQDLNSLGGKILRINADGSIPEDNPFENSPVYSLGHRNPQGLDWDPATGRLVISEHGPSGERGFAHDEINIVLSGENYGWPDIVGDEAKDGMSGPVLHSGSATWAPSGATFYDSHEIPEFAGKFLVATLAGNHLKAIDLDLEDHGVLGSREYFLGDYGRLRDVASDAGGNIYILTSNQDGRGSPAQNDDRILMITPVTHKDRHGTTTAPHEPPLKQLESMTDVGDIKCNQGLTLVFKNSGQSPACVRADSVEKLIERGWAAEHHGMSN